MRVTVAEITKNYGPLTAIERVSFEALPSSIVAVLGPNGAGKTTLLRVLAGIAAPDRGEVLYDTQRFTGNHRVSRRDQTGRCARPYDYLLNPDSRIGGQVLGCRLFTRRGT